MSIKKPYIYTPLMPLSWIYGSIVRARNKLFDCGILKSRSFDVPVICVGNISVGGTGKTPHTEYLIRLLKEKFHVTVLSRGYKRKSKGFVMARKGHTTIKDIGDEPFQMWTKFPDITMAVDSNRCNGIENILKHHNNNPGSNVIILDDAFQHRYVKAGMNILLIDYNRPIYGDAILPAGRLREQEKGKERADVIIVSKCPTNMLQSEKDEFIDTISPGSNQDVFFSCMKYDDMYNIFNPAMRMPLENINENYSILLLTGIASPKALINTLGNYCKNITTVTYQDHHNFSKNDIRNIEQKFFALKNKKIIITTEKDAARLISEEHLGNAIKQYIYALPIRVEFLDNAEQKFNQKITEYVRKNSRNSSLS